MSKAVNNIVELSQYKKKFTSDDIYNKCHDRWISIKRACDQTKTIVAEAVLYIAAIEFLFLKNPNEVIFDGELLVKKFAKGSKQRSRYLRQLSDLYNIEYHSKYTYNNKTYRCVFSCTRTANSAEILNDPIAFYNRQTLDKSGLIGGQKSLAYRTNLSGTYIDIDEYREEIEDIPYGYISSISQARDACARQDSSQVNELLAACDAAIHSLATQGLEGSKPRIVITAAMQTKTAPLPQEPKVRGLASSSSVITSVAKEQEGVPRTDSLQIKQAPILTANEEKERIKTHRNRQQAELGSEPKHLSATILSLLPKLTTATEEATVENEPDGSCQMHTDTTANEANKMTESKLPYRLEEEQWARDFKVQMNEGLAFEHEVDSWQYKAALRGLDLTLNGDDKVMTLEGNGLDISDLKKKHLKAFATRFYEVLSGYTFQLIEAKK